METEKQEVSQVAEVEHEKAPPAQVASSLDSEVLSDSEVPPPQVASSQNSEVEQEKAPQPLSVLASSMDSGSDYDQGMCMLSCKIPSKFAETCIKQPCKKSGLV